MFKLKQLYLSFLEKDKKNAAEIVFHWFLEILSWVYGAVVGLRNFFYDHNMFSSYRSQAKVISIGNISWAGSGKTSLAIWLNERLSVEFKVAILRRGYGRDEELLLKEISQNVYSSPDRCRLAKELGSRFEILILDDGFQYRRLKRELNLVVIGAREFSRSRQLIPADFFREPWSSLKRADLVLINYADEISDRDKIISEIKRLTGNSSLYFSNYRLGQFIDLSSKVIETKKLQNKRVAVFTAIGYPQGFLNKLKESGLNLVSEIIYPDHHELSDLEYKKIETDLLSQDIHDLIITSKDRYHLPAMSCKLNIIVMEIELQIENELEFLAEVRSKVIGKGE
ncbi:MAG: tetraacyldisaccharide 4'-kinase [Candidatus Omnitrophica bacterium]|nr:tetraacyldisaccharide 4'-kinase [Candidatus Omnitrophota bacterium]